jgi:hypothetical protein
VIVGKKMASDAVIRRERLADLPDDPAARADAIRRQASRNTLVLISAGVGAVLGLQPMWMLDFDFRAWFIPMQLWLAGGLAGTWWSHRYALRSAARPEGLRVAQVHRRRIGDYLMPGELVVLMWSGLAASCAAAAGVVAIAVGGSDRESGVLLTSSAASGLLIWFAALLVQRRTLAVSQPAGSESSFRWEEAERSQLLRDLLMLSVFGGFTVTVTTMPVLFGDMSEKYPDGVVWAVGPVLLGTYLLMPWAMWIGSKAKAWRRMPAQLEDATS